MHDPHPAPGAGLSLASAETPRSTSTMRTAATWFLDQTTLPRHEELAVWSRDLTAFLEQLMPRLEERAAKLPANDVPARVAMVGVGEARRRLYEKGAAGLHGETERVRRLARSVVALCDHHDTLSGASMCLACDKPIDDGRPTMPYEHASPSGGARVAGRIHVACANAGRHRREL